MPEWLSSISALAVCSHRGYSNFLELSGQSNKFRETHWGWETSELFAQSFYGCISLSTAYCPEKCTYGEVCMPGAGTIIRAAPASCT